MSAGAPYGPVRSPVLLIIFRRPDLVIQAIERLRLVRPQRLYVAADGPRPGVAGEAEACEEARRVVRDSIDWPCQLEIRFRTDNLGVRYGPVDAIDWFLSNEPEGIILEDDIAAEPNFFRFCDELLERYRDDPRVAAINGTSYWKGPSQSSYHASNFIDMWGWATWRDRWLLYDAEMKSWPSFADAGNLAKIPGASPRFVRYWTEILDQTKAGLIRAWDYQWMLTCWTHGLLALQPAVPLVVNKGFRPDASNTMASRSARYCRDPQPLAFPLIHPASIEPDPLRERAMWAFRFHISKRDALMLTFKMPLVRLRDRILRSRPGAAPKS